MYTAKFDEIFTVYCSSSKSFSGVQSRVYETSHRCAFELLPQGTHLPNAMRLWISSWKLVVMRPEDNTQSIVRGYEAWEA